MARVLLTSGGTAAGYTKAQLFRLIDRAARKKLKAELRGLATQRKKTKRTKRTTIAKIRAQCRASKLRARARVKAKRAEHKRAADRDAAFIRDSAKQACDRKLEAVYRREGQHLKALELEAERAKADFIASRMKTATRKDAKARVTRAETREESDAEVIANQTDPALVAVFRKHRKSIKAKPGLSRTEAFAQWIEENRAEVREEIARAADEAAAAESSTLEAKAARIEKLLGKTRVTAADLRALEITCPEVEQLGLLCKRPGDVVAAAEVKHFGRAPADVDTVPF